MTRQEMNSIIKQLPEACKQDAHYKLYQQAAAALDAINDAIESDWPSANVDKATLTINGKDYTVGLWSADVIGSLDEFLIAVQEYAVDELKSYADKI